MVLNIFFRIIQAHNLFIVAALNCQIFILRNDRQRDVGLMYFFFLYKIQVQSNKVTAYCIDSTPILTEFRIVQNDDNRVNIVNSLDTVHPYCCIISYVHDKNDNIVARRL